MEIRQVDDKGELVVESPQKTQGPISVLAVPAIDPLEIATQQVLGIETDSQKSQYDSKVKAILEWAMNQTDDHTPEGIKWAVRDMQMKIGSPRGAESPIDYLFSYVALSSQKKEVEAKLKKYNPYG